VPQTEHKPKKGVFHFMDHKNSLDNQNSLEFLHAETLKKLEWHKMTKYLANFCVLSANKEHCLQLDPFQCQNQEFYFNATFEMQQFFLEKEKLLVESFAPEAFQGPLKRQAVLSPFGLYQIFIVLRQSQVLKKHLFSFKDVSQKKKYQFLQNLCPPLFGDGELADSLQMIFVLGKRLQTSLQKNVSQDFETNPAGQNVVSVLPTASLALESAHKKLEHAKHNITQELTKLLQKSSISAVLQEKQWLLRNGRYVLPLCHQYKGSIPGILRGISQSGSTLFIEPHSLAQAQALVEQAQNEIEIQEHIVLKELSEACFLAQAEILLCQEMLMQWDLVCARAQFAAAIQGVPPQFLNVANKSPFSLVAAKHPLFLLEKAPCVPNDLTLSAPSKNIDDLSSPPQVCVLSGPNAGGKTLCLKTLGLNLLMAKAGLFVSCKRAEFLNFTQVFVALGDNQDREHNFSTFSAQLTQIKLMTHFAHKHTLILLDEGFVGTDPQLGLALARATLEYFANQGAHVLMTTHFVGLKALASTDSRFMNASMEFEPETLSPSYRLLPHVPGQSYALELAQRLGMPASLLENAKNYSTKEAQSLEVLLKNIQQQHFELQQELEKQKAVSEEQAVQVLLLKKHQKELEFAHKNLIQSYRAKLKKYFDTEQNQEPPKTSTELAELVHQTQNQLEQELAPLLAQHNVLLEQSEKTSAKFKELPCPDFWKKEMNIRAKGFTQRGRVIQEANKEGFVTCQFGLLKTKILHQHLTLDPLSKEAPPKALQTLRPQVSRKKKPSSGHNVQDSSVPQVLCRSDNTLLLLGKTVEEAQDDLALALENSAPDPLVVVHGHGTGKLKAFVRDYLKRCPLSLRFRPGTPQEGGDGATVVQFL
jgi:DNA mismatch repair protein MutS2